MSMLYVLLKFMLNLVGCSKLCPGLAWTMNIISDILNIVLNLDDVMVSPMQLKVDHVSILLECLGILVSIP